MRDCKRDLYLDLAGAVIFGLVLAGLLSGDSDRGATLGEVSSNFLFVFCSYAVGALAAHQLKARLLPRNVPSWLLTSFVGSTLASPWFFLPGIYRLFNGEEEVGQAMVVLAIVFLCYTLAYAAVMATLHGLAYVIERP